MFARRICLWTKYGELYGTRRNRVATATASVAVCRAFALSVSIFFPARPIWIMLGLR